MGIKFLKVKNKLTKKDIGRVTRKIMMSIFCTLVEFIFNSDQLGKLLVYTPSSPMTNIVDIESMLAEKNIKHLLQPVDGGERGSSAHRQQVFKERWKAARQCLREKHFPEK